jgi:hypothetical protein
MEGCFSQSSRREGGSHAFSRLFLFLGDIGSSTMTHDLNSLKKVAVLTGLTVLIGGAEISNVDAATVSEMDTFGPLSSSSPLPVTQNLSFNGFSASAALAGVQGQLTGVQLILNSSVHVPTLNSATASVEVFGTFPHSTTSPNPATFTNPTGLTGTPGWSFNLDGLSGGATLADYMGSFSALLTLNGWH